MTLAQFKDSLTNSSPPEVSPLLQAMWYDGNGNWNKAHDIAQEINSREGSWIHAYLHRKEGDLSNAQYWYYKAKRIMPAHTLQQEWEELVQEFIANY